MGNLSCESREQNRKDKVTRLRSVTYARQQGLLVNTLGSHLKAMFMFKERSKLITCNPKSTIYNSNFVWTLCFFCLIPTPLFILLFPAGS